MRSISRVCDVSINTVTKLLIDAGEACLALHDETVRDVKASRVQCDEIWSFVLRQGRRTLPPQKMKRAARTSATVWTWTAIND